MGDIIVFQGVPRAQAFTTYITMSASADDDTLQNDPTFAAGDVVVSLDGGAIANVGTLAAISQAGEPTVTVVLSATEMNAAVVVVQFEDQTAGEEWKALTIVIHTAVNNRVPTSGSR